ncbi:MAG: hypothetical protein ACKVTZ_22785 [Bacteroidia bacterium]
MKIIFATYKIDDATEITFQIANKLTSVNDILLADIKATRSELQKVLLAYPNAPLFVLSHGTDNAIIDNDGVLALDSQNANDIALLIHRPVFAYCCWTANGLGDVMKTVTQKVYWGYTGQVIVPADSPEILPLLEDAIVFVFNRFDTTLTPELATQTLTELKQFCDNLLQNSTEISTNIVMRRFWTMLRVFLSNEKITHVEAIDDLPW